MSSMYALRLVLRFSTYLSLGSYITASSFSVTARKQPSKSSAAISMRDWMSEQSYESET